MKKLFVLAAAALLFAGAENLQAQTCHEGAKKSCCASKHATEQPALTVVGREDLVQMIKAGKVTVVDARSAEAYQEGHIDGALSIAAGATLPEDKTTTLVFYCGGLRCPLAEREATKALELGYTNVLVYKGGWSEWENS
jgi:rhodanese-related sulfurtransferase